jgi:fatty acid desaturase
MLIWVSAFLVSIVLYMTVGWTWAWIPYVVGFLGMMLLLTRMLFGEHDEPQRRDDAARKDDER